ncbi:MAG: hypothetical protein F6K19_37160 [Cyanothece sp. SIO1E1]|nr:hypothetical protein [Cyanothece sp. SIO1E1]
MSISMSALGRIRHHPTAKIIYEWLERQLPPESTRWLTDKLDQLIVNNIEMSLYTTFSSVPRRLGKDDLYLTRDDASQADAICPGWTPRGWSVDQAARTLLLLELPPKDRDAYGRSLHLLFDNADVNELIALNQSLPLLPYPELHLRQAINGIRSNITAVFNAIALNNPYPTKHFDELSWNQLVLKSLFIDSPLHQIQGLDSRANVTLARMVSDYAHERWAAHRSVNPELWRLVGPFAKGDLVADLERVLKIDDRAQQEAAALACAHSPVIEAKCLLEQYPELHSRIQNGQLSWDSFVQNRLSVTLTDA